MMPFVGGDTYFGIDPEKGEYKFTGLLPKDDRNVFEREGRYAVAIISFTDMWVAWWGRGIPFRPRYYRKLTVSSFIRIMRVIGRYDYLDPAQAGYQDISVDFHLYEKV